METQLPTGTPLPFNHKHLPFYTGRLLFVDPTANEWEITPYATKRLNYSLVKSRLIFAINNIVYPKINPQHFCD